ncbi:putative NBD/HSP70 family sugar kinase [Mycetocola sp. CAN_C7]|uniref:ROK family transcriptional regulator n=1 Tax=Mycetocola sp. CAN_C7 TaxID=2787724 RepID=UPI0018C983EA
MTSLSPADIRHVNALSCVHVLRSAPGALSISDVAARTGLSRPTVDAVVADLESRGLLIGAVSDQTNSSGGRPARHYRFDADSSIVAGIDAGPTNIRVILANLRGTHLSRVDRQLSGTLTGEERVNAVVSAITDAFLSSELSPSKLKAACVGVSGIVSDDGTISQSFVVPELNGVAVARAIGEAFDAHVFLENDIKLAGFAEHHLGAADQAENIIYLQIGHRISMSLMIGGNIHQGAHRSSGEVGSQRGMRWTSTSVHGQLTWSSAPTAEQVFANARNGDRDAMAEIERFVAEIAPHITMVGLAFDPDLIVVGGGLSRSSDPFVDMLRTEIHRLVMLEGKPAVTASTLGSDGTLYGALALAFQNSSSALFGIEGVPVPDLTHRGDGRDTP